MNDPAPSHEDRGPVGTGQLTGEQHLISVVTGSQVGFHVVLLATVAGLDWPAGLGLAAAAVGAIVGILAFVKCFSRWNRGGAKPRG